jgi:hypothetical protein
MIISPRNIMEFKNAFLYPRFTYVEILNGRKIFVEELWSLLEDKIDRK